AVGVDAAAFEAAGAFNDPEVFAKLAAVQVDVELLGPKDEEPVEAVRVLVRIAVMPAVDETNDLRTPGPVAAGVYLCVHGGLHLVEVACLIVEEDVQTQVMVVSHSCFEVVAA